MLKRTYINIFNQLLRDLDHYDGQDLAALSDESGVSLGCLYKWKIDPPISPHLRTFFDVAQAMGYTVELKQASRRSRHAHLKKAA